jgi:hypothetical protein
MITGGTGSRVRIAAVKQGIILATITTTIQIDILTDEPP